MMHERISFNGTPVVGFGATAPATAGPRPFFSRDFTPILYPLIPAVGGALLGYHVKKGTGAVVGGIVGGAVGGLVYFGAHFSDSGAPGPSTQTGPIPMLPASTWRRIPLADVVKVKAGQQLAMAFGLAGGAPLSPQDIASIGVQLTALKIAPVNLPTKNFVSYPPGAKLPPDWPADDDLGPNAYRVSADVITDAPLDAAGLKNLDDASATADGTAIRVWVRDPPK